MISNQRSLIDFLDQKLPTIDDVDQFLDDLEDEIFGMSNREFYLKFKGDIKELLHGSECSLQDLKFESELLLALKIYCNQRKLINN